MNLALDDVIHQSRGPNRRNQRPGSAPRQGPRQQPFQGGRGGGRMNGVRPGQTIVMNDSRGRPAQFALVQVGGGGGGRRGVPMQPQYQQRQMRVVPQRQPRFEPVSARPAPRRGGNQRGRPIRQAPERQRGPAGTKVLISNLHFDVDEATLREKFATYGQIVSIDIKFDSNGRSTGDAEVVFSKRSDAENIVSLFSGIKINDQAIFVSLASTGKGRNSKVTKTAEQLDLELQNYRSQ
ncbi:hypothetical protein BLNAU_351 [Blattamonas nauphoetae]|uniref:RRM domain-containing protein n=1 Tax=Blattamonas nauphoetae TaxID=2049346 RepID=A0ABQ9YL06_9EUKA|nr:hypothetical protein BLNAU_351 [Blattamonas nauphoetae]